MVSIANKHPYYHIWTGMKQRCSNRRHRDYFRYGGRGIRVCEEWRSSFDTFVNDMGVRPSALHSLDRINNDGNYEPRNCRWATKQDQVANRRLQKNNTLGYRGVHLNGNRWAAQVNYQGHVFHFGQYDTVVEAAYVRDQVAMQLNANASLNFDYS